MPALPLLGSILEWARARPDIRTVIQTGSHVRPGGHPDRWSDLDLEVFTTEPEAYEATDWMAAIAPVWVCLPLTREDDARYRMRLTVFEGGAKVDFAIAPVGLLAEYESRGRLPPLYERGYRVLLDRDGLAARLPTPSFRPPRFVIPTEAEYRATIEEFWFEASEIPKYLVRDELWVVKFRDWTMKTMLLRMLEWHAAAGAANADADVWHIGRGMSAWLEPQVLARLADIFGRYDQQDSWRALLATTGLFGDLARVVGSRIGYAYADDVDRAISGYIQTFAPLLDRDAGGAAPGKLKLPGGK